MTNCRRYRQRRDATLIAARANLIDRARADNQ